MDIPVVGPIVRGITGMFGSSASPHRQPVLDFLEARITLDYIETEEVQNPPSTAEGEQLDLLKS